MFKVNSTRRKRPTSGVKTMSSVLDTPITTFFEAETANTLLTKPWLRLERGLRIQKLRAFSETHPDLVLDEEREALFNFLLKANDNKQLNTKSQIQYDDGVIQNIKGLKIIRNDDKPVLFKIETGRQTKRSIL
jgi:hypothetical protein